ncbi:MAG TPA: hypothetical protein VLA29_10620 [Acidimicrobiia bacterium]|nr:hypothetical protein [Acidimicrobiia bacterium]
MARSRIGSAALAMVIASILSGCGSDPGSTEGTFESAMETCGVGENPSDVRIDDGTSELRINNKGDSDNSGIPLDDVWCLLEQLEVTDEILDRMVNTSGSDGEQEGAWGPYTVTWTYFPPRGLDVFVRR